MNLRDWLFRRRKLEEELDEEVQAHLRMAAQERVEQGESPEQARTSAVREFGNVLLVKEVTRDMWGFGWLGTLLQDLRFALRILRKNPGFTAVAVLTLALGIGANTTIFSLVNRIVLHPLPYPHPERLVRVETTYGGQIPAADFAELRRESQSFESLGYYTYGQGFTLTVAGAATRLRNLEVSPEVLDVLGVTPLLGHNFSNEETAAGMGRVVILSYALWRQYLEADRGVVGKTINLDDQSYTVIGVMPEGLGFPDQFVDAWTPMATSQSPGSQGMALGVSILGRLKPGVDLHSSQAELNVIAQRLARKSRQDEGLELRAMSLQEESAGPVKKGFLILLCAVGMVLLLACLNVANVLLARNARRRHEIAVRAALGASRLRLIRQLLVESLIIACLGGGLGLLCAPLGIHLLRAVAPPKLPRLDNVGIDGWVLAFTLRLSIVTGILVGMLPAIQGSRAHLFMSLKEERGSSPATSGLAPLHRMQSGLTAYQVALATILLVGAGLVVRSFARLMSVDLGFDPHNLLTVWLSETSLGNLGEEAVLSFYNRTLEEVRALPGVEAVALGGIPPVGGGWTGTFIDVEGTSGNVTASRVDVQWQDVSPAYFTTMRIRILKGRGFTSDHDRHVVVINQAAARRFWPNANPVGRRIHMGLGRGWCEIVGVAADARDISLDRQPTPQVYSVLRLGSLQTTLLVRTISRPQALANAVLNRIWYVDKDERVLAVTPMENVISKSVVGPRFHVALLSLFALLALLMAGIGVYGVVACSVSQRTHEIGVRLALGARRRDVFALVVGQQLAMTILGVALGLGIAFALTRTLASLLYDVRPTDPVAFAGASVLLIVSALLASFIPARRATKVDPMVALRYE